MNGWKAGEAIGLITATAFALTVVYLHGYRTASDLDLFAYISLNDYFRIAVGWLVPVALGLVCALPIEAAIRRSEHGRSENEIMQAIAKGRHAGFWLAFRKGGLEFPFVVAALAVVVNTVLLLSGYAPRLWYYQNMVYASPVVWFAAVKRYEREKRLVTNWNATRRAWVWFFPAVLILSFFKGALTGEQAKVPPSNATSTRVFVVGRPSPIMGRVLFNVENYILLRTCAGGELEAIAKGQVSLIVEPSRQWSPDARTRPGAPTVKSSISSALAKFPLPSPRPKNRLYPHPCNSVRYEKSMAWACGAVGSAHDWQS